MANPPPKNTRPYALHLSEQRGHIQGLTYLDANTQEPQCHFFGGIPYALPPLGPFRFRKPRPLPPCYGYGTRSNPGVFIGGAGICPQPSQRGPPRPDTWDEDCLQLNIWLPAGEPPSRGWPILFFLHGGFLQFGSPNGMNFAPLLGDLAQAGFLVVAPAYRVGVLGFLASPALTTDDGTASGNWGFHDQRLALEWTYKNASYFRSDAAAITLAGYSAGAHSAIAQLAYDVLRARTPIVRRALLLSNSPGPPPRPLALAAAQFDALATQLGVPADASRAAKAAALRAAPAETLVRLASDTAAFPTHQFRAAHDASFGPIDVPALAAGLRARGVEVLIGENAAEHAVYGLWRPPAARTRAALQRRLEADYAPAVAAAVLPRAPPGPGPHTARAGADWGAAFGAVYADVQVHALQRGFVAGLAAGGAGALVRRYRIEWRARCSAALAPLAWGATHGADLALWLFGMGLGGGLSAAERGVARAWCAPVWAWVRGERSWRDAGAWEAAGVRQARWLRPDGSVGVWDDVDFERGCRVWDRVQEAAARAEDEARQAPLARL